MNWTRFWTFAAPVLLCALTGSALWAQSDQPSLADIARRKTGHKAKVVVTNDQIPPSPEANNPPASAASGAGAAAASNSAAEAKKGDAAKAQLPPEKQTQLQALQTDRAQLQQIIKHLEEKIAASNDEQAKTTLNGVLQHAKEALAEDQKQIDKLQAPGAAPRSPAAPGDQSAPTTALPK